MTEDFESSNLGSNPGESYKRGGAEVACWAHNPKVPGSKPGLAINKLLE